MHALALAFVAGMGFVGAADAKTPAAVASMEDGAAATYEHLATVIIEVRLTENSLVKGILMHYRGAAVAHLKAAQESKDRAKELDLAAEQITNIANEGDKKIQAIRQRLAKAGHTHNSDADTKEDYLFVNSKKKKEFLALAKSVSQLGAKATAADIAKALGNLNALFDKAMEAE